MAIVLKIGSNVATDERGELREDVLASITDQAAALHKGGNDVVLVTSGAISRGINLLGLSGRPQAMDELQASSAVGQGQVYRRYDELFAAHGVKTAQILLTFGDMSARTNYVNARRTLKKLLEWHVVPVINENDTTATDEITFGDNDFLAAQVAILVRASRLVLASDIDSLYTADPNKDESATPVHRVDDFGEIAGLEIGDSATAIGSGGMRSKVVAAEMATAGGIPVVVCSGKKDGAIARAAAGDESEGTHFTPHDQPDNSFKLWLRYAKESCGTIVIDAGAERALTGQGTSLLPVGIVDVTGEFSAGDAVEIAADDGRVVAKGIVNYSAEELRQIKGMKLDAVQRLMPRATDEAVHRDHLVLT